MGTLRRLRMSRSIRKLVGGGAAALALGGFFALIVAPQLAGAASGTHSTQTSAGVKSVATAVGAQLKVAFDKEVASAPHLAVTVPTGCTTARTNLAAAVAKDKTEEATERTKASSD